jgi:hypothetical protein
MEPTAAAEPTTGGSHDERSLAELTKALADQTSRLAQQEIELAKAEVSAKGKRLGIGAGAFGGAAIVGLFALGALTAAAILALAIVLDAWLAALVASGGLGLVAGVLALTGKKQVEQGTPPVPEQAIESTKTDVRYATRRAKEARS